MKMNEKDGEKMLVPEDRRSEGIKGEANVEGTEELMVHLGQLKEKHKRETLWGLLLVGTIAGIGGGLVIMHYGQEILGCVVVVATAITEFALSSRLKETEKKIKNNV